MLGCQLVEGRHESLAVPAPGSEEHDEPGLAPDELVSLRVENIPLKDLLVDVDQVLCCLQ
jgi:hypothetical protein